MLLAAPLRRFLSLVLCVLMLSAVTPIAALASTIDTTSVVDAVAPFGSTILNPGDEQAITMRFQVTGNQTNDATFTVNTRYVVADGVITESQPVSYKVPARTGQTAPYVYSVPATVAVGASQAGGTFTVRIAADAVVTSGTGKLAIGTSQSYAIQVVGDTAAPVISVPADITTEATSKDGATVSFAATAHDGVDGDVGVSYSTGPGSTFPLGETVVTVTASDSHGNTATKSFNVTVTDSLSPVITAPDVTAEASGASGAAVTFSASAVDTVDGPVAVTYDTPSGSTFALGDTIVTARATDAHGNAASKAFKVTVSDTTGPAIVVGDVDAEATGPGGAAVSFGASADDAVDGPVGVTFDHASGSTFALGTTDVVASATDAHGNTTNRTFHVTVSDSTAPVITASDVTAEATGPGGAPVTFGGSALDLVDGPVDVVFDHVSGSTFPLGTTDVLASATDAHGNGSTKTIHVTVQDTTPPSITVPDDIVAEATGANGAVVTFATSAEDLVDGPVGTSCSKGSGETFSLGDTTVTVSAEDSRGNSTSKTFKVTVRDTTPPEITVPDDMIVEASGPSGAFVSFSVSAEDIVDGVVAAVPDHGPVFPLGETTVTVSAADSHGNGATRTFKVVVVDTTAPQVTVPADITAEATGPGGAVVTFTTSANDLVDGAVATICSKDPGETFPLGETTVTVTATDAHGNTGSNTFKVRVVDTTAPALTLPADITVEATGPAGNVVTFAASAHDAVDSDPAVSYSVQPGSVFKLGTTTVNVTATDDSGNTATGSFTVAVRYGFGDVQQPINTIANTLSTSSFKMSVFKAGSTIPVKFTLAGGSAAVTNAVARLYVVKTSNGVPLDGQVETLAVSSNPSSPDSTFRFDGTAGQYIFNYGTKGMAEGTYRLRIDLGDGSLHTVDISLKK